MPIARTLVQIARGLTSDGGLHDGVDVSRGQIQPGGALAIDVDLDRRLAEWVEDRKIDNARDGAHGILDPAGRPLQFAKIVAEQLDRVLAFHPGGRLLDVVLDVLREVEVDSRKLLLQSRRELCGEPVFVDTSRPGVGGFQRYEEFGIEKPGGIRAVVRAAVL